MGSRVPFWAQRQSTALLADELRAFAGWLEQLVEQPPRFVGACWLVVLERDGEVGVEMGEITVPAGSGNLHASVQFLDADGNPTTPDQLPSWSSSDEAVATVRASADGMSAEVTPVGSGSAVVECVALEQDPEVEVRASGLVNVLPEDASPDAVVGEVTFEATEATQLPAE